MNWNNIRPLQGSQNEGFEELVCQLARKEKIKKQKTFIRKGKPDAGVECYWILEDETEVAWQAKYFTTSLSFNQWGQVDKSVETTLNKHPNLKKYYVAIPNDPPDARLENQDSMLDKWNDRVDIWKNWAENKNMEVEFLPWWSSDMIERLQRTENAGLTFFWFNKEELTNEWVNEVNDLAIVDLGKRYTPEVHVELEVSKVFNSIARDDHFESRFTNYIDDLLINAGKVIDRHDQLEGVEKSFRDLKENVSHLNSLFNKTILQGINPIDYESYSECLKKIISASDQLYDFYTTKESEISKDDDDHGYYKKHGYEISRLRNLDATLYSLRDYLKTTQAKVANQPCILIEGEAGIGKSHLLADAVTNFTSKGKGSLLLLGQQFVTDEDPWHQILKKLHLKCNPDEFLGALNSKAQITGNRFIIFIDAINEGKGRYFWGDNLKAFIRKVSKYEWVGLVLSIRSSYVDLIAPKDEIKDEHIIRYLHYGFADIEYEASKIFFSNYGIELPSVPLLHPEFQNPLFLKLFCEGLNKAGHTRIPDGIQGISSIINFFIDSTNTILHKPNRLDYPKNINVVKQAIEALMSEKLKKDLRYIKFEDAFIICDDILSKYSSKRHLLDELISEGVLSKNLFYLEEGKYEEGVYLTYERFEDHTIASHLLTENTDLELAFSEGGALFEFIKDGHACYYNRGIIDALTIQLPEKFSIELYEFAKHLSDGGQFAIAESLVDSLLWRKIDSMHDNLKDYINNTVFKYDGTHEQFLNMMVSVSVIPNHPYNAFALNKFLSKNSMANRDAWWSFSYLRDQLHSSTAVKRLIDWSWNINKKEHISDESILLASIALSWFLCTPNRVLRDYATKAIICLLQHRLHLVIKLLKRFEGINDPYIYDRLFAVAYGASLRASDTESISELSEYIFETIFKDKEEVYPHILLRDYARGVIEYTHHLGLPLSFDITLARPPYKSALPGIALSNEELNEKYEFDYDSKDYKKYYRSQNIILRSMTTEYGKGIGGYGDFGRYTFQSALRHWNINAAALSNIAVEWIFEKYGYDVEKHGELDNNIGYSGRKASGLERIGKKYQWIAMYEMLARVADNVSEFTEQGYWYKEQEIDVYSGPWEPYVRDIDPTLLINDTGNVNEDAATKFWWVNTDPIEGEINYDDWLSSEADIPNGQDIISIKDDIGEEWLVLEGYPEWAEKRQLGEEKYDNPHKRMWWNLQSYLVKNEDWNAFSEWFPKQNFWGNWMPESRSRYEMYNRESYWSPAYNFFKQIYYSGELWRTASKGDGKGEFDVMVATDNYMWEEEFDFSKEKTINLIKLSGHIFENMRLQYSEKDGDFVDNDGKIICFDPSVSFDCKPFLLIRKNELIRYLEENNLKIVWTMIGEKQIIGGSFSHNHNRQHHIMELSGNFRLDNDNVVGNINTELK